MSGGRKVAERRSREDSPVRVEAARLAKETGIPKHLAHQVALGSLSLHDVLSRMATRAKVEGLVKRHGLPKSLATQIALGQADLNHILRKRRLAEHIEENRARSILVEAQESGEKLVLGLHGKKSIRGVIKAIDAYEVQVEEEGAQTHTIHKLQIKYACREADSRAVRNQIKRDKERKEAVEPIWKPQDRYGCSDRRLFAVLDEKVAVTATTLEGEIFNGTVAWMGRWEFGMALKKKNARVVVFRHALADFRRA
ncbi:MAG: hypothetical protein CL927_18725 [Deltaproteobacteria bacterium]|nr:hypothetical protein [Deltaproteobacteria bacterium]HCH62170.1 hypothetical protein [Deltaproteobacteria bacterium]